jgi:hypothetical protein
VPALRPLLFCLLLSSSSAVIAGNAVWIGKLGEWTQTENWQGKSLPDSNSAVLLEGVPELLIASDVGTVESVAISDGSTLVIGPEGKLTVAANDQTMAKLTVDSIKTAGLQVRGGTVTVKGPLSVAGADLEAANRLLFTDGAKIQLASLAFGRGTNQLLIGPQAAVTLTADSRIGEATESTLQLLMSKSSLASSGRDYWGGTTAWKLTDASYHSKGQLVLGASSGSFFKAEINGASKLLCSGPLQLADGTNSTALVQQNGGIVTLGDSFEIAHAKDAKASYRIAGGTFSVDTVSLGRSGNGLAEFQIIGSKQEIKVNTVITAGTVGLSFITDDFDLTPLKVANYVDVRAAAKAILKVDVRLREKSGMVTVIDTPRLNGKFTHVQVSYKGQPLKLVDTQNLAPMSYRLEYGNRGLDVRYRSR